MAASRRLAFGPAQPEAASGQPAGRSPDEVISLREAQALLHQELAALPGRLRLPLVLCYLQGRTRDEAARRLGWSLATLGRRLEQGRKLLHARLSRRGLTLAAVLSASLLSATEAPAALTAATLSLATSTLSGSASVPASVALMLARLSWSARTKTLWGLMLMLGACAGASVWVYEGTPPATVTAKKPSRLTSDKEKRESVSVTGQVLDPKGKPLTGSRVTVLGDIRRIRRYGGVSFEQTVLGQSKTDRDGRFCVTVPRPSSGRSERVDVAAVHAGYGLIWQSFATDAPAPPMVLRLRPEQILHGRLIDLQGQPVAGAKLPIVRIHNEKASIALDHIRHLDFLGSEPARTDKKGNFIIRGLAAGTTAHLYAEHERSAPQRMELSGGATKTFVMAPAHFLEGRVFYADSGKPAAHVEVGAWGVHGQTDERCWFRLNLSGPSA